MENITSKFTMYSFGVVVEPKSIAGADDCFEIQVDLREVTPAADGVMAASTDQIESSGTDSTGQQHQTTVTTSASETATWLKWGSNRLYPPDMRPGMRVMLWIYGDNKDTLYWTNLGLDDHLLRLETVIYGFSGLPDGTSDAKPNPSNMYTFEISTHTKQITMRTCAINGEATTYVFQFNTGDGVITLSDAQGNSAQLFSVEGKWKLQNSFGSFIEVNQNVISMYAAEAITAATREFKLEANSVSISADTTHVECPDNTITGNLKVGRISTGVYGDGGGVVSNGNMSINGQLVVSQGITCAGINSSQPIYAPNID